MFQVTVSNVEASVVGLAVPASSLVLHLECGDEVFSVTLNPIHAAHATGSPPNTVVGAWTAVMPRRRCSWRLFALPWQRLWPSLFVRCIQNGALRVSHPPASAQLLRHPCFPDVRREVWLFCHACVGAMARACLRVCVSKACRHHKPPPIPHPFRRPAHTTHTHTSFTRVPPPPPPTHPHTRLLPWRVPFKCTALASSVVLAEGGDHPNEKWGAEAAVQVPPVQGTHIDCSSADGAAEVAAAAVPGQAHPGRRCGCVVRCFQPALCLASTRAMQSATRVLAASFVVFGYLLRRCWGWLAARGGHVCGVCVWGGGTSLCMACPLQHK